MEPKNIMFKNVHILRGFNFIKTLYELFDNPRKLLEFNLRIIEMIIDTDNQH